MREVPREEGREREGGRDDGWMGEVPRRKGLRGKRQEGTTNEEGMMEGVPRMKGRKGWWRRTDEEE